MEEHNALLSPSSSSSSFRSQRDTDRQPEPKNIRLVGTTYEENSDPRRWWILLTFNLFVFFAAYLSISYHSLGAVAMEYLNIDEEELLRFQDIHTASTLIFSYPTIWLVHNRFRQGLLLGFLLSAIGGWIQYCASSYYAWIIVSRCFLGIGCSSMLGLTVLIPHRWFPAKERLLATTISIFQVSLGMAFALLFPLWINTIDSVPLYNLCLAIGMSLPSILGLFCLADKPAVPQSYSALVVSNEENPFWEEMKKLLEQPRYVLSIIALGIMVGAMSSELYAAQTMFRTIQLPNTYQTFTLAGSSLLGSIVSNICTLHLIRNKSYDYDPLIKIFGTAALLAVITGALALLLGNQSPLLITVSSSLAVISLTGIIPFAFDSIAESTFPIPESISSNTLAISQGILTILMNRVLILPVFRNTSMLVLAGFLLISWIYIIFYFKTDYKQQRIDLQCKEIGVDDIESMGALQEK